MTPVDILNIKLFLDRVTITGHDERKAMNRSMEVLDKIEESIKKQQDDTAKVESITK